MYVFENRRRSGGGQSVYKYKRRRRHDAESQSSQEVGSSGGRRGGGGREKRKAKAGGDAGETEAQRSEARRSEAKRSEAKRSEAKRGEASRRKARRILIYEIFPTRYRRYLEYLVYAVGTFPAVIFLTPALFHQIMLVVVSGLVSVPVPFMSQFKLVCRFAPFVDASLAYHLHATIRLGSMRRHAGQRLC